MTQIMNLNFISEDPFETNLSDINFSVNRGECLGIAGISGNGQSELFQVLSGEIISDKNSIEFNEKLISLKLVSKGSSLIKLRFVILIN